MEAPASPVKPKRGYDATRRRELARQSRERVITAAEELFLRQGYAGTTIGSIAQGAGVSVDTIYKGFGGKPGLVRAIVDAALLGRGPVPAEHRSDALQAGEPDPRKIIRGWGRFVMEISPRVSPITLLAREAAVSDADVRALVEEIDAARLRRMTQNAQRLAAAGHLRAGVSVPEAADVLWTYSSAELYDLLVVRRGMSIPRYGAFVADAMIAALLPPEPQE
ncbi:MAG TPA: TetR/AcrR family transcriptional regulator [Actinomycetota bacterium]|nr:TetR/AcrR family transcriptional regulator [Actinomycetota bacterium]